MYFDIPTTVAGIGACRAGFLPMPPVASEPSRGARIANGTRAPLESYARGRQYMVYARPI